MASSSDSESLEFTPTWVLAGVCTLIILISLFVERFIHYLGKFLKHTEQNALYLALQKVKEELMLLGFISLLLTVSQTLISHICIPSSLTSNMLPCNKEGTLSEHEINYKWNKRRLLSTGGGSDHCTRQDKVPLLSLDALHQLHIFIFVLAVVHVVFCVTTMLLGGAKLRQWKHWEDEIHEENQRLENASTAVHQHEFLKERSKGSWVMSFFKQFHASVSKSDYKVLQSGFIMTHRVSKNFDFHKYMMRVLEDDFRRVVGISWYLWLFVIVFLLLNVHGWHAYFWLSFLPLLLLLAVGTKLEHVITQLAQEMPHKSTDQPEAVRVKPSDRHFWFRRPGIVLYLIHFILFQNAFEIAYFFWIWSTYGFHSCIMERMQYLIPRLVIGVIIQVLCSYSTLPLYAIVTQMGESYKRWVFEEHMQLTLHGWIEGLRKKKRSEALSSFLSKIGLRKKPRPDTSDIEIRTNRMATEACELPCEAQPPVALEEIVALEIQHWENAQALPQQIPTALKTS